MEHYRRFHVGNVDPSRGFVHVLDDVTLEVVLGELDTISDLLCYLRWKEQYITGNKLHLSQGEENLLGAYLSNINEQGQHDIVLEGGHDQLAVLTDVWETTRNSDAFKRKKQANEISYYWDRLIDEFGDHILGGTIIGDPDSTTDDHERVARVLAKESRLNRRMLVHALMGRIATADRERICWRISLSVQTPSVAYVFGLFPFDGGDYDAYRTCRRDFLQSYCFVLGCLRKELRTIVGIATESHPKGGSSTDAVLFESPTVWTDDDRERANSLRQLLGIHDQTKQTVRRTRGQEYPQPVPKRVLSRGRTGRNHSCPCGSGVKFKRCCGRPR